MTHSNKHAFREFSNFLKKSFRKNVEQSERV